MRLNALLAVLLVSLAIRLALEPRSESASEPETRRYNVWVESTPAFGPSTPSFWPANLAAHATDRTSSDEVSSSPVPLPTQCRSPMHSNHKPVVVDFSLPIQVWDDPRPWTTLLNVLRYLAMKHFRPAILVLFDQPRFDELSPIDKAMRLVVEKMCEEWRRSRL